MAKSERIEYLYRQHVKEIGARAFKLLVKADPTPKKIYLQWLINVEKQAQADKPGTLADDEGRQETLHRMLSIFNVHKHKMPNRDIMSMSYDGFMEMMNGFRDDYADIADDVKVVYDGGEGKVLIPLNIKAAARLAEGSDWCTNKLDEFDSYHSEGRLYVFIPAKPTRTSEKYQLHSTGGEFRDERENHCHKLPYPEMWKAFIGSLSEVDKMIALKNSTVWTTEGIDPGILIHALNEAPGMIKHIENPSEELQIAAVKSKPSVIKHIGNPCRKVRLLALERDYKVFYQFDSPTPEEAKHVVDKIYAEFEEAYKGTKGAKGKKKKKATPKSRWTWNLHLPFFRTTRSEDDYDEEDEDYRPVAGRRRGVLVGNDAPEVDEDCGGDIDVLLEDLLEEDE